jgi:SAM-dependent methyltransferase
MENINENNQWNEKQNVIAFSRGYNDITDRFGISQVGYILFKGTYNGRNAHLKVLDYGCGYGRFGRLFSDIDRRVIGVDTSQAAIDEAFFGNHLHYHSYLSLSFEKIESGKIPFIINNSLDGAVANFVFCTIQDDSEIIKILKEIKRVIKPKSSLILCDPHPESIGKDYISFKKEIAEPLHSGVKVQTTFSGIPNKFYDIWRSKEDYVSLLERAGYFNIQIFEPIIEGEDRKDELFWKDERRYPPFLIIKAIKKQENEKSF